jgi:uncharacterized protein with HEPN domain
MPREAKAFLRDILEAARRIEEYIADLDFEHFCSSDLVRDGVVRNLEIIGEATKNLPKEMMVKHPEIEWKKIVRMRDILTHAYFGVDETVVWDVATNKLGALKSAVSKMIREIEKCD